MTEETNEEEKRLTDLDMLSPDHYAVHLLRWDPLVYRWMAEAQILHREQGTGAVLAERIEEAQVWLFRHVGQSGEPLWAVQMPFPTLADIQRQATHDESLRLAIGRDDWAMGPQRLSLLREQYYRACMDPAYYVVPIETIAKQAVVVSPHGLFLPFTVSGSRSGAVIVQTEQGWLAMSRDELEKRYLDVNELVRTDDDAQSNPGAEVRRTLPAKED